MSSNEGSRANFLLGKKAEPWSLDCAARLNCVLFEPARYIRVSRWSSWDIGQIDSKYLGAGQMWIVTASSDDGVIKGERYHE
jgi:hypothetical protein